MIAATAAQVDVYRSIGLVVIFLAIATVASLKDRRP